MKKYIAILFFICIALLTFSCSKKESEVSTKPLVITTIEPYSYFVKRIAGDTVDVKVVVPASANPHIFEPTLKKVATYSKAKLWIASKEPFEKKMTKTLKERNISLDVVDVNEGISLFASHCHEDGEDRHTWLSPSLAQIQANTVARALITAFPENRDLYRENLYIFLEELASLDHALSTLLAPLQGSAIVLDHPVLSYFCQNYGLSQIALESEGKEPLPKQIASLLSKKEEVRLLFTQKQFKNKGILQLSQKLKKPIKELDPYATDYFANLRNIAIAIIDAEEES